MDNYARYSDKTSVQTLEHNGDTYIDQGYRFDQKVRVRRGDEIAVGTVISLNPDLIYSKIYVEKNPPTITVEATWGDGRTTKVDFDPQTGFPPDFEGQQFHFQELLD